VRGAIAGTGQVSNLSYGLRFVTVREAIAGSGQDSNLSYGLRFLTVRGAIAGSGQVNNLSYGVKSTNNEPINDNSKTTFAALGYPRGNVLRHVMPEGKYSG
jgi:hypothetical protein